MQNLDRFIKAQERDYNIALEEIKSGHKQSHWVWYIFPQLKGLGYSETAQYYAIEDVEEAKAYVDNEYLYNNLIKICQELLKLPSNNILDIMGYPDNLKLCSSMTLFHLVKPDVDIFKQILDKYYDGKQDSLTINLYNEYLFKNTAIIDGIIGFSIGDALGVPAEFKSREELKRYPITDMVGDGTYNVPAGTFSDDTSMTLATIHSIIETGTIDTNDMADKFLKWFREAEYTATGDCFDIGRTTLQALAKYELKQADAVNCGGSGEYDNGNGSLMRILPIAYYIYYKQIKGDKKIYELVRDVSSITHSHEISVLGCYIYTRYCLSLLEGKDKLEAYNGIKKLDYSIFSEYAISKYSRILKSNIARVKEDDISSSGYVVSTLEAVMWLFLNSTDYNTTILKAVNLGEDTDTVGAISGGLLGIYYGIENIKDEWKKTLKRYDYILDLCDKFKDVMHI